MPSPLNNPLSYPMTHPHPPNHTPPNHRSDSPPDRITLHNATLVLSTMELEQYLFKATLYRVQPAGFKPQLEHLAGYVRQWEVSWLEPTDSVFTEVLRTSALTYLGVNLTAAPQVAVQLQVPGRAGELAAAMAQQSNIAEHQLTHIGEAGMNTVQLASTAGLAGLHLTGTRDVIMLTTNVSFKPDGGQSRAPAPLSRANGSAGGASGAPAPAAGVALDAQLRQFLADNVARAPQQRHMVMGIVTPPVALDLAYTLDLVALPAAMPAGYFSLVNIMATHLAQGPRAMQPDATVLLPDVWTHLLWSVPR